MYGDSHFCLISVKISLNLCNSTISHKVPNLSNCTDFHNCKNCTPCSHLKCSNLHPLLLHLEESYTGVHILIQITSSPCSKQPVLFDVTQCRCGKIFKCVWFNSVCTELNQPPILAYIALLIDVLTFSLGYQKSIYSGASDIP